MPLPGLAFGVESTDVVPGQGPDPVVPNLPLLVADAVPDQGGTHPPGNTTNKIPGNLPGDLGWWAMVDLNHRPHAYQACALTG